MRVDLLLYRLRLAKSRSIAQALVATGRVRRNRLHVAKSSEEAKAGDVLAFPLNGAVRVIEIIALPCRRGPASEAAACYREIRQEFANVSQQAPGD